MLWAYNNKASLSNRRAGTTTRLALSRRFDVDWNVFYKTPNETKHRSLQHYKPRRVVRTLETCKHLTGFCSESTGPEVGDYILRTLGRFRSSIDYVYFKTLEIISVNTKRI